MGWVRSKPVHARLTLMEAARPHLFASMGRQGAEAVRRAIPGSALHLHAGPSEVAGSVTFCDAGRLMERLRGELSASPASSALYLAGPERFIWQCHRVAREGGMSRDRIFAELAGSAARTVYCVHCKTLTPDVTTNTCVCGGCGQTLFVRDHFSRLLAAYAGVRIDAEAPGEVSEPEILYA